MTSKTLLWTIIAIVVIAFIILPTFTPEDLFTTVPLLGAVGWKKYLIIAVIAIVLVSLAFFIINNNQQIKDSLKRKKIIT